MKLNLRHKIILTNLIVLLVTFLVITLLVVEGFKTVNRRMLLQNLVHQAEISIISIKQSLLTGESLSSKESEFLSRSKDFASRLSAESGIRVRIFSKDKVPVADSEAAEPDGQSFEELDEVIKGNRTYVIRKNEGSRFMHFTFPVMQNNETIGEVMFIYSLKEMDKSAANIFILFAAAFTVGIIIVFSVSILLSFRLTKPIYQLQQNVGEIMRGNYTSRIRITSSDEIGDLAEAFNRMSAEIESRINIINFEKGKLNSILESMGEGVMALDAAGRVIAVNSRARAIMDGSIEREIEKILLKVKEQKSRTVVEINPGDKSLLVCATPLALDSEDSGAVLVLNDVTELRLLQEKQRQFVTNVSHELKTPLTTIIGYVDLLATKGHDRDVFDTSVHYLKSAGQRLLSLVNDLIDLSCLSKFEFEIELKSTNLTGLVRDIAGQMALKAQKFNIQIETELPEIPDILADPARIKQAVVNLLDNAIKYSPGGKIEIKLLEGKTDIHLVIHDTGCGIPSAMLDKIFEPFYRVDKARSRKLGGNGLGLAITKEIIEKHNGRISIDSREGEGTKVCVILPKLPLSHTAPPA